GAGSTWNDIVDRDLDGRVERTRNRPLPSGQITPRAAAIFAGGLSLLGLAVLLSFNSFAIGLGFLSLLPVAVYPFMKRITDYPQFVLGLAFSWGALMGWAAVFASLSAAPLLLYAGAVLWVIGYDTIYALQDVEDDGIVGIRSTALKFGARAPQLVAGCYTGTVILVAASLSLVPAALFAWLGLAGFAAHLAWQVSRIDLASSERSLALFRSNWHAGLILAAGLALDTLV
ncbi:MAG: 4-hydroxybenzoate octaprenyltransferase, partial [Beijerinckiaceae bacterium]